MAGQRMVELADRFAMDIIKPGANKLRSKALNQAARELVLAESSDWAFIMQTGTMVPYAHKRTKLHISRFTKIHDDLLNGSIDEDWLKEVESRDNIFSSMNCAAYYLPDSRVAKEREASCKVGQAQGA